MSFFQNFQNSYALGEDSLTSTSAVILVINANIGASIATNDVNLMNEHPQQTY